MTDKQKALVDRLLRYSPLLTFATLFCTVIGGAFYLGSLRKDLEQRVFDDALQKEMTVASMMDRPSELEVYLAIRKYDSATEAFFGVRDTLMTRIAHIDTVSRRNATTIYQMKEGQRKFFKEILEAIKTEE